jgi:hypothetical protein
VWRQEDYKFKASLGYVETVSQKNKKEPAVVIHIYNPSYSGGGDWENLGLR